MERAENNKTTPVLADNTSIVPTESIHVGTSEQIEDNTDSAAAQKDTACVDAPFEGAAKKPPPAIPTKE